MIELWNKYKDLVKNIDGSLESLNEGATHEDISKIEKMIGVSLPVDFAEFYKIHDGQDTHEFFFGEYCLNSLDNIIQICEEFGEELMDEAEEMGESKGALKYGSNKWLFFARDGGSSEMFLDLDPGPKGKIGQVGVLMHGEQPEIYKMDFRSFVESIIDDISSQRITFNEDAGAFVEE